MTVGYSVDLKTNTLMPVTVPNEHAGREHLFRAWRPEGSSREVVTMREVTPGGNKSDGNPHG